MSKFEYEEVEYEEVEWDTPPPSPTSTSCAELESLAKTIAEALAKTCDSKTCESKKSEDLKEPQVFERKRRGNVSL